jgi:putative transposase
MNKLPKAKKIVLQKKEKELLRRYVQKQTAQTHYKQRGEIILLANEGMGNNQIAKRLGIINTTVRKWRNRWASATDTLKTYSKGVNGIHPTNKQLLDKMLEIVTDAPRPGKPIIISQEAKKEIIAMACEKPKKYKLPMSTWTHKLLAQTIIKQEIIPNISARYVGIILKKTSSSHIRANTGSIQI